MIFFEEEYNKGKEHEDEQQVHDLDGELHAHEDVGHGGDGAASGKVGHGVDAHVGRAQQQDGAAAPEVARLDGVETHGAGKDLREGSAHGAEMEGDMNSQRQRSLTH